jgi:hypothetical protein
MGRGVAESRGESQGKLSTYRNWKCWERHIPNWRTYRTYQTLLWGGVRYIRTMSLQLDSSLLRSDSQNTKELICWATTPLFVVIICLIHPRTCNLSSIYIPSPITSTRRYQIPHRVTHSVYSNSLQEIVYRGWSRYKRQ